MLEKLYQTTTAFSKQEEKIKALEKQLSHLETENQTLTSLNLSLLEENQTMKNQLQLLSDQLSQFRSVHQKITSLRQSLSSLQSTYQSSKDYYDCLTEERIAEYQQVLEQKKVQLRAQYQEAKTAYQAKLASMDEKFLALAKEHEETIQLQEFENLRRFISYDEFFQNTSANRCQLALHRYNSLKKTPYEVGLMYERYIGYLYETEGYTVRYHGAVKQYKDRGIDIIVNKKHSKDVLIIQCKNWNQKSVIRENTISQLAGSVEFMKKEKYPTKNVSGILYATCGITEEAQQFAEQLNIKLFCHFPLKDYPKIKCNQSTTSGEKIYHLPFDFHYDRVFINPADGDLYVSTTQEAERYGFRHAKKWKPREE